MVIGVVLKDLNVLLLKISKDQLAPLIQDISDKIKKIMDVIKTGAIKFVFVDQILLVMILLMKLHLMMLLVMILKLKNQLMRLPVMILLLKSQLMKIRVRISVALN